MFYLEVVPGKFLLTYAELVVLINVLACDIGGNKGSVDVVLGFLGGCRVHDPPSHLALMP